MDPDLEVLKSLIRPNIVWIRNTADNWIYTYYRSIDLASNSPLSIFTEMK
jgi:hypothetical protein